MSDEIKVSHKNRLRSFEETEETSEDPPLVVVLVFFFFFFFLLLLLDFDRGLVVVFVLNGIDLRDVDEGLILLKSGIRVLL